MHRRAAPIRNSQEPETITLSQAFTIPALCAAPVRATNRQSGSDILVVGFDGCVSTVASLLISPPFSPPFFYFNLYFDFSYISLHIGRHKIYTCTFPNLDFDLPPKLAITNLSNFVHDKLNVGIHFVLLILRSFLVVSLRFLLNFFLALFDVKYNLEMISCTALHSRSLPNPRWLMHVCVLYH